MPCRHHRRSHPRHQERYATASDESIIAPHELLVQALVTQRRATLKAIETFDHAIAARAQSHPDFSLFDALPGAGAVLARQLLAAFGEHRKRYTSADDPQ
jgi:hypothetical protein